MQLDSKELGEWTDLVEGSVIVVLMVDKDCRVSLDFMVTEGSLVCGVIDSKINVKKSENCWQLPNPNHSPNPNAVHVDFRNRDTLNSFLSVQCCYAVHWPDIYIAVHWPDI